MLAEALEAEYLKHLEISDNCQIIKPENKSFPLEDELTLGWGELRLPIGAGTLPLKEIVEPIKNAKDIPISIEVMSRYRGHWKKNIRKHKRIIQGLEKVSIYENNKEWATRKTKAYYYGRWGYNSK